MKQYVLAYFERGDMGEMISHKEIFITKIAAIINYWLSCRDKRRLCVTLKIEEKR